MKLKHSNIDLDDLSNQTKSALEKIDFDKDIHPAIAFHLEWTDKQNGVEDLHSALVQLMGAMQDSYEFGEQNGMLLHKMLDEELVFGKDKPDWYTDGKLQELLNNVNNYLHRNPLEHEYWG